jgi:signal transduction histidine kinase
MNAGPAVEAGRSWSRLAPFATVVMAALMGAVIVGNVVLDLTMPAGIPSYDALSASGIFTLLPFVPTGAIALLLTARRPQNPVGWLLGALVICFGLGGIEQAYLYHSLYVPDLPRSLLVPLVLTAAALPIPALFIQLLLVFPNGHLLSPRWRPVLWLNASLVVAEAFTSVLDPAAISDGHRQVPNPIGLAGAHGLLGAVNILVGVVLGILLVTALVSLGIRYRRAGSELREQLKWFGSGVAVLVFGFVVAELTATSSAWATPPPIIASTIGFFALPASIGIAVLKYRLYDIDLVISRALVYGSLAAFITAVYVGIAVGIGTLIGGGGKPNLGLSILATAIVAVGFQPVRERVQKVANRLVYGKRATPYEVLSQFSERVADSYATDDVMLRMAHVLAEGTGAQRADVWLRSGMMWRDAAAWPADAAPVEPVAAVDGTLPPINGANRLVEVRHQGDLLGALSVTKRAGESLTPVEENLLSHLAGQAGLVLKNVGLTSDLQARLEELRASRQRLVTAQDEERRRLERNLHDGAQQHLVAIKVKLGLAEMLMGRDPAKAKLTLDALKSDADEALETLRDLARGIYPPLLADRGLPVALESQARKATVPVTVDADGIGRYSQEVEAAAYFCVLEALQNVQKYAHASNVVIRVHEANGMISFEVDDNGDGFDVATVKKGAGLTNMADRLDALGGAMHVTSSIGHGTTIAGSLDSVPATIGAVTR